MNDSQTVAGQTRNLWAKLPRAGRLAIVATALTGLVGMAWLAAAPQAETSAVLFTGLAPEDASAVLEELRQRKIAYRLESGGSTIFVPSADVHELRIDLAARGMPRGGAVGFEIFDQQGFGTTAFVEQMNYRRALEGELARTIAALGPVESARVHLTLGERSIYRKEERPPSASVMLRLSRGQALDPAQVQGIVNLVASSIDGLEPQAVTVVDDRGRMLGSTRDEADGERAAGDVERTLATRIETLIAKVVGEGKVAATVTVDLDTAQVERTAEVYDQSPENHALRSESRIFEGEDVSHLGVGGVIGARGNLSGEPAVETESGRPMRRLSETRNYEVTRRVERVVEPRSKIRRVHVAILVDGVEGPDGVGRVPRAAEELSRIEALAREAAGLDAERGDRIEVHSVPFAFGEPAFEADAVETPVATAGLPQWALGAGPAALLMLAAGAWALARRRRRSKQAASALALREPLAIDTFTATDGDGPRGAAATVRQLDADEPKSLRERALFAAQLDPHRATQIISGWLTEPAAGDLHS